jgi:hypothetical protein
VTFGDDPRDWEIYLARHHLKGAPLPRPNGILPVLREELPAILERTRKMYAELRTMNVQGSKAEFLSINAGARSREGKVRDTLAQAEKVRRRHVRPAMHKMQSIDVAATMEESVKLRYQEVHGNQIEEDLASTKTISRGMMKHGHRMIPKLREYLEAYGIDLKKADRDITWDDALERVMINRRSRELVGWDVPPVVQRQFLANRIQYVLEIARRLGGTRVPEPGDQMDAAHVVYLSAVVVMTADKRTTSMLHSAKEPRIRELARARLRRGGNANLLREALELLRASSD